MKVLRSSRIGASEIVAVVNSDAPGWHCSGSHLVSKWQTYDAGERGNDYKVEIGAGDLVAMINCLASSRNLASLHVLERVSACVVSLMSARIQEDVQLLENVELDAYENKARLERELIATEFIATHLWHKANGNAAWGTASWHSFLHRIEWKKVKKRLAPAIRGTARKIETGET